MEKDILIKIDDARLNCGIVTVANPNSICLRRGDTVAVVGENGSGKTLTAKAITAKCRYSSEPKKVRQIEFSDIHSLTGCQESYYQQRFEASMNDEMPTVGELMEGRMPHEQWNDLCDRLSLHEIEHKRINFLSSGELRKFLIVNMMTELPDLLILDNPYIGLDAPSRLLLNDLLQQLAENGVTLMLLLCNPGDIPPFASAMLPIADRTIGQAVTGSVDDMQNAAKSLFPQLSLSALPSRHSEGEDYEAAFELHDCRVAYGKTTILEHVDWRVNKGEHWALLGENGSGKSTLLSLVCADNPQSYSNNINIFDRRRGTGETIWDIKRRIGYLSPEMHLYFRDAADTLAVVASGLREVAGFFKPLTEEQKQEAQQWMDAFGIGDLASRRFPTLSSGEQRLALLVRTLIKRPQLLILDEPLHGLDASHKALALQAIEQIAANDATTLVYVTHYESEIPKCVDKRKILNKIKNNKKKLQK